MHATSRVIATNQLGPHKDVARRVARALDHPLRKPVAAHTREAFERARAWYEQQGGGRRPLILDAGCGVGLSTRQLAARFDDHLVIGVDRSADRLSRAHGEVGGNALLVRADLVDFWRLALASDWQPARHYLLYPNPYPKSAHLKQRWHGHPVLPVILALGGRLELRSNWRLYVEEFALALHQVTGVAAPVEPFVPGERYLTPFERKYHLSGQSLWRLAADLPHAPQLVPGVSQEVN
ncbi:methyltransferase domain-containing protein [Halomonas sp. MCCC 1A17488]|uniref:tRNA (guanine(46)-N(7))-methyltransferase TrmB n=1 Tax=unclassified Halomonas TaxID=2609666 RepID=UPI0018D20CA5|nr:MULTISPECIES: methyltransferase domain-containing protein [unclassified Halomonas]MCE8018369.1 methyltransferase domain-containing protein [Halomonas sp. MCCC 1A17488]MCG3241702.1 methyltransferase domain-containing protein [Halomonas sp. MCCC 1A17488]QPP49270.1 methyltransferase domain-containing protein [Halomonas sp. SS10-MC5]